VFQSLSGGRNFLRGSISWLVVFLGQQAGQTPINSDTKKRRVKMKQEDYDYFSSFETTGKTLNNKNSRTRSIRREITDPRERHEAAAEAGSAPHRELKAVRVR